MKPVINSHLDYRRFLNGVGGMYRINWRSRLPSIREIYLRFRELDLSAVDRIMQDQYSNRGPEPRPPSCMLRSLLLMIVMNVVSITHWVEYLHTSKFFAILSGFQPWDIPGVGTFYDFIDRLWNLASPNFSSHVKPPVRKKVKKPKGKGQKAASIEKESVAELIARLSQVTFSVDKEAYGLLFQIFRTCFLDESIRLGKVNPHKLHIAGDGTPVVTAARFRSHHTCDCWKKGIFDCDCNRYFPQPDCSVGWDSSRDCWYFGYDLYLLTDDLHRQYAKFRCPLNNNGVCSCQSPCSSAKYGRTCSIPMETNIRLYNDPPRKSDEWMLMYNKRTASERCNKRIKLDYLLEAGKHHSTKFWYVRLYLIMMLIHVTSWDLPE